MPAVWDGVELTLDGGGCPRWSEAAEAGWGSGDHAGAPVCRPRSCRSGRKVTAGQIQIPLGTLPTAHALTTGDVRPELPARGTGSASPPWLILMQPVIMTLYFKNEKSETRRQKLEPS